MTVETPISQTRTCANCGAVVSPDAKFCRSCGASVVAPEPAARPSQPPQQLTTPAATSGPAAPAVAPVTVEMSLLNRAKRDDRAAIETMFKQFLPPGEAVDTAEYLGVYGFWGFGRDSFGVVTDRRIGSLQVGSFGEVLYQDASLEHVNSTVLYQPSRIGLYVTVGVLAIVTFGIALLLAPVIARGYYRRKKSGLVLAVREGVSVYVFIDRKRMLAANRFYREVARLREDRVRRVGLA